LHRSVNIRNPTLNVRSNCLPRTAPAWLRPGRPPVDGVDAQYRSVRCCDITFQILGPDVGSGTYTYQIDWDGNGSYDQTLTGQPKEIFVEHEYHVTGTYPSSGPRLSIGAPRTGAILPEGER
jgi:hypothetical protein